MFDSMWEERKSKFGGNTLKSDIVSFAFRPNSRYIASGGSDGRIRIWNTKTWRLVKMLKKVAPLNMGMNLNRCSGGVYPRQKTAPEGFSLPER